MSKSVDNGELVSDLSQLMLSSYVGLVGHGPGLDSNLCEEAVEAKKESDSPSWAFKDKSCQAASNYETEDKSDEVWNML